MGTKMIYRHTPETQWAEAEREWAEAERELAKDRVYIPPYPFYPIQWDVNPTQR